MKVGDRLGRFELTRELGRGSHGVVFEATDVLLGERVAIKALQPWLAGDVTLRERFKRELVLTRRVSHPGVARLHDLHEESGILFISMQYVEGRSLSQILRVGLPGEEKVLHILRGVCGALAAAHAEGVVHRDLKPANIMVTDQDKIIVLDFGIATATGVGQLTRPGEAMGSVPYVPPEVWEGGGATALGDQYALAVTGFVCLTRELPYNGKSPLEVLDAIRQTQATIRSRVPDVDPELEAVILKAMAKAPEDRYPSIGDFDEALRAVAERRGISTKPPTGASSVPTPSSTKVPRAPAVLDLEPMPLIVEAMPEGVSAASAAAAVAAAIAEDGPQDAGAAAVAAALEEDAFAAAFDAALPETAAPPADVIVPSPQLGGAAASRAAADAAARAEQGDFKENTAVEGHDMLPFATAIMDAPQGLTAPGGEPLSMASSAFVEAVADPHTIQDGAPIADQAAAAAAVDAMAEAFEAGVVGKPSPNKTELVDRKRINEVLNDVTMIAPMPTEPELPPPAKKSPMPLVLGGLAVVAVVLGILVVRGGDDGVVPVDAIADAGAAIEPAIVDAGAAIEPAVVDAGAAADPAVVDAGAAIEPAIVDAGSATEPAVVDAGVAPTGTGELTLDDLDAPPPDPPPPPDPTGTAKPRLSSAGLDAVAGAAAKKGIRGGDVPALDAAVAKGRKAARANDKAGLEAATKSARAALDATTIDKAFVSDKLARFNSAFDKVKDPALKAKVQPVAREVLKHISKGQWQDANKKLNDSWAMIKKGR